MSTSGSVQRPIVGLAPRTQTASPRAQVLRELLATTGASPGQGRGPNAQERQEQVQVQHAGTSATSSSRPRERVARITLHNALSGDPLPVEVVCCAVLNEDTAKPEQEMVSVKELKRGIAQAVKVRKWAEMRADARQLAAAGAGARTAACSSRVPLPGQEQEDDQHSGAGHKLHLHAAGTSKREHGATALEDVAHTTSVPLKAAFRKAQELHPPPPDSDAAEYDVRVEGELHALFIWADMHELIGSWPIFSRPGEFAPNNPRNYVTVQYGCGNSSGGRGSGSGTSCSSSSLSFQPARAPAPAFGSFGPQYRGRERTGRPREDVAQQYVDLMRLRFWVSTDRQRPDGNQPIGDPEEVAAFEGASREKKLAMLYKLVMEILDLAEKAEGADAGDDVDASAEGAAATMAQHKGAEASCPRSGIIDRGTQEIQVQPTSNRRPRGRGREVQMEVVSADNWRNSLAFKMARRLKTTAPQPRPLRDKALREKVAQKLETMSKPEGDRRLRCALWRTYWQQAPDRRACVCGARANAQYAINEKASSPSSTLTNAPAAPTQAEQTEEREGRDGQWSQSQSQSSRGKGSPAPPVPPPKGAAKGSKTTQGTGNYTSNVRHLLREDVDDDECKSTIQTLPCICRCSFEHFYDINVNPLLSSGPGAVTRPVLPAPWVPWQLCEVLRMPLPEDAGAGTVSGVEDLQTGHEEGKEAVPEALPADVPMSSLAGVPSLPGLRRSSSSESFDDLDDSAEPLNLVPVDESVEKFLALADLSTRKFCYLVKPHLFQAFKRRDELQKALTTLRLHPIIRRREEGTAAYDAMMATYGPLATWDLSGVTDLSYLFGSWPTFAEDVSGWNVSNVRNMQGIFEGCRRFDSELNDWDVGQCEDFRSAFERCETFDRTLVNWRVRESGKSFSRMFSDCSRFNQDLRAWRLGLETAEGNENSNACSGTGSTKSKSSQELSSRQLLLEDMFCRCVWMEKPPVNWPYFRKIVERWMEAAGPDGSSVMMANLIGSSRPMKVKKLIAALTRGEREPQEVLLGASTSSDSESEDDDDSQCQSGRENHMQNEGTQPMNKFMRVE